MFFGQKYGNYELPGRVEKKKLDAIYAAARIEYNLLQEAREAEQQRKREAEQLRKLNKKNAIKLKAAEEQANAEAVKKGKPSILAKKREPEAEENDEKEEKSAISAPSNEIIDPDILYRWYQLDSLEKTFYILKPIR
jgi:hypothetical protein